MTKQDTPEIRAKAKAFDRKMMNAAADARATRKRTALKRMAALGGADAAEARKMLAKMDADAAIASDADKPSNLSTATAGLSGREMMRVSMESRIRSRGQEPVKR